MTTWTSATTAVGRPLLSGVRRLPRTLGLLGLTGLALLAGCGGGSGHDEDDVAFATGMIGHHAQAIEMANYTIGRQGLDPRVVELAESIRTSQTEEINTLSDWLEEWDEPVPETGFAEGDGHTHSDGGHDGDGEGHDGDAMPGMMAEQEMQELATAPDARFEQMWLQMMIEHHRGAVEMADAVLDSGESEDVAGLAEDIKADQTAEIADMEAWLAAS